MQVVTMKIEQENSEQVSYFIKQVAEFTQQTKANIVSVDVRQKSNEINVPEFVNRKVVDEPDFVSGKGVNA